MQLTLYKVSNTKVFFLFLVLGLLLYGNTLSHDFVLDDAIVIGDNEITKKGFSGIWDQLCNDQFVGFYGQKKALVSGGRYRPLSMVVFNIQYGFFGESAFVGHLTNLLFYVLNGFLLYLVLSKLFSKYDFKEQWISFPLLASLLWFFHPIHTEVVANIKGLDEIMAFSFELLTLLLFLRYLETKKISLLFVSAAFYFLALLSKENAITWLALFPIIVFLFTKHPIKKIGIPYGVLFSIAVLWFYIRLQVVGGGISDVADNIMNDPFLESTVSEKYATIMYTLGKYIQLLIFPHPLTYDYYPKHIPIVTWSHPYVMLSLVVYIALIFFAIKGFLKKKLYSFSILIFLITLSIASNIVFPIGAFMNERFVYVSSVGISIMIAFWFCKYYHTTKRTKLFNSLLIVLFCLYAIKTISRNPVWKNNYTLSINDANISVNGAKSNVMAGGILSEKAEKLTDTLEKQAMLKESVFYLDRAIQIYPEYIDALILMGNAQWNLTKDSGKTIPYYRQILSINPNHDKTWRNIFFVLEQEKNVDARIQTYLTLLKDNPSKVNLYLFIGLAYGKDKNDLIHAQKYLEQGLTLDPNNYDILTQLGTLYGLQGRIKKSDEVLERARLLKPKN
ncbi:hypothetical protein [Aquimarina sp. 2201CG14-23]|uniref:hypothetical protein n=1 Tax=Aquimarina mycalae TaxID=3040073 RepID=UPI002477FC84|nr:hypothetical protein [Aquimarina sp. 2201CG14-23]MDH7445155.1 hypothetical protein [Aquimarina sp. 2201CG14-23]